jgi:uncharacterized damage-inducible protein DinB
LEYHKKAPVTNIRQNLHCNYEHLHFLPLILIMNHQVKREVWQRGPVDGIAPLLQPVAHALLQAVEELQELLKDFQAELLWKRPANLASPAFHLQHMSGVIDRLFTYAKGAALSKEQLEILAAEGKEDAAITVRQLLEKLEKQVDSALLQLMETKENILTDPRGIGRAQIPTTVMGLLFHAAEHTMRHLGQLLVTVKILKHSDSLI